MRRLRVGAPSGLCWACGGSIPYNASSQKRTFIDRELTGVILNSGRSRRRIKVRRSVPAFDLPLVVLDLDAEDSPHVRPFNKKDAAEQTAKWAHDPILPEVEKRVDQLEEAIVKDRGKMDRMLAARYSPYKISDLDVLSVALCGSDGAVSSQVDRAATAVDQGIPGRIPGRDVLLGGRNKALNENGIPQRILAGDANTIIRFMLHRQRQAPASPETASASVDVDAPEAFETAVKDCKSLNQLKRLCAHVFAPGHEALTPTSMDCIARWFTDGRLKKTSGGHREDSLKFINNLTMRQLSGNTSLSPALSRVGLALAAKMALLPAIIQYLHICLSQGFIGGSIQDKPATLGVISEGILQALDQGDGSARGTRPELFTLLTGRPCAGSTVQPSLFGSSIRSTADDYDTHRFYVQLLGQLGAHRLLWHSWKQSAETEMRQYTRFYCWALTRCAEVLRDAKNVPGLDTTTVSADLERDAELDLQAIDALDAYHASSTSSEEPYAFRFGNPFLPIGKAMQALQSPDIHRAVALMNDLIPIAGTPSTEE
ncbi:hypothetical protein KVR01_004464 [Diaporthe batatas]|uniref:uncharacterized protein n=1 Tax=Diaporthe batatas TaxID=748121 RepID=UPI001D04DABA|nr:uncharacterized protein KVR01_004464 [Diaporthe batatas]KAG8165912.1 hypothetical protein KVR01_004464 [Diaporthe batatas]